jgi:hypothetical protein
MTETSIETLGDRMSDTLAEAVRQQQDDDDPAHEDFYTWGWLLSDLTMRLDDAARVLARQVSAYGDRRILRDDEDGVPAERLAEARGHLDELRAVLGTANTAARAYHSSIGHIGVEVDAP